MLVVVELVVVFIFVVLIVTQILIPAFKGILLFPMFRSSSKLKSEIIEIEQEKADAKLAEEVAALRKTVKKKKL